jgi:REP element-mobilizing transposase RayT
MGSPIAYFITFRTYGTWLHGDARSSIQQRHRGRGPAQLPPLPKLECAMEALLTHSPVRFAPDQRDCVADTIRKVCEHHTWIVHALAVLSEHVHMVVSVPPQMPPERVMNTLKSWATRRLVESGLFPAGTRAWGRHGSTRYIWTETGIEDACRYVSHHEGAASSRGSQAARPAPLRSR